MAKRRDSPMGVSFHDRQDNLPSFDELPKIGDLPQGATWGLWDKDGVKDELGTLNLLRPSVVQAASKELQAGISVALSWSLNKPSAPNFYRKKLEHTLVDHADLSPQYHGFDDVVTFNTQCSSQWDGLRHHALSHNQLFYNGVKKSELREEGSTKLGIQAWSERGGIVARGVLIDYVAYAQRNGIKYSPVETHHITVDALEAAAKDQGVEFKPGDILIVRAGLIKWYNETEDQRLREETIANRFEYAGVQASEETVKWLWNKHFSAVAGDAPAFESLPMSSNGYVLHDYCLSLYGMPIGEFWDLEKLAQTCERLKRYSFLVTSAPLNVDGGVASPPNTLAIF